MICGEDETSRSSARERAVKPVVVHLQTSKLLFKEGDDVIHLQEVEGVGKTFRVSEGTIVFPPGNGPLRASLVAGPLPLTTAR